jgi:hypothetical protein
MWTACSASAPWERCAERRLRAARPGGQYAGRRCSGSAADRPVANPGRRVALIGGLEAVRELEVPDHRAARYGRIPAPLNKEPPSQPTAALEARKVALRGILDLARAPRRHPILADVTKVSFAGTRRATMT